MPSRRDFLTAAALSSGAFAINHVNRAAAEQANASAPQWPIAIFEKVFEALSYKELAEAVVAIGADGVEATIRPGGHIEPAAADEEVAKMQAAMRSAGKAIVIAATHIRDASERYAEPLLRTLVEQGITHYRMGHYYYDLSKPVKPQLENYAAMARDLAALNREIGIQGLYQNHASGKGIKRGYVGALGWDAAFLLDGIEPDDLGMALDTRHLRMDTGSSWRVAVKACKEHVRSIYVKDGIWTGERGDQYEDVALDTGFVNKTIFDYIRDGLPPMPLCIHMEWLGYRVFEKHEIPSAIEAHQRDIAALRRWIKN